VVDGGQAALVKQIAHREEASAGLAGIWRRSTSQMRPHHRGRGAGDSTVRHHAAGFVTRRCRRESPSNHFGWPDGAGRRYDTSLRGPSWLAPAPRRHDRPAPPRDHHRR
jgi:hypothetical protein